MLTSEPTTTAATPPRSHSRRWHVLVLLSLMEFMLILDGMVVNVALPSIQRHLGMDTAGLAWVLNGYTVVFGGFMLLAGRTADLAGRRRMLLAGLALFAAASLSSGLAVSPGMLIASRVAQGLGAAIISPAALSLIITAFADGDEQAKALGAWGAVAVLGGVSGTVVGGLITDAASWRWIFFVNVPVAAVALVLVPRWVPESRAAGGRLDVAGALTLTAGVATFLFGLLRTPAVGWGTASLAPMAVSLLLLAGFVALERRAQQPLLPMRLLRYRPRAASLVALLLVAAVMPSVLFLTTLYFQRLQGYTPMQAGLALFPAPVGAIGGMLLAGRIVPRLGARTVLVAGALVAAIGVAWLSRLPAHGAYPVDVLPGVLLAGLGSSPTLVAAQVAAVADLREDEAGVVSGLLTSALQVGAAVGLGVLVAVAAAHTLLTGTHLAFAVGIAVLLASAAIAAGLVPNLKTSPRDLRAQDMTPSPVADKSHR